MQPRDPVIASRAVSQLCLVAGATTIITALIAPTATSGIVTMLPTIAVCLFLIVASLALRRLTTGWRLAWTAVPFLAALAVVGLDLLTTDSSAGAQVFFIFPVLYGASQLPRIGAMLVCAWSVASEATVVFILERLQSAALNLTYVAAALIAVTLFLINSADRQDTLVMSLRRMADVDSLTGLVTRRVLDGAVEDALKQADTAVTPVSGRPTGTADSTGSSPGSGTALILLDVDEFKAINDRHGHPGGDEVLITLARLLRRESREGDLIGRMGGDELALLLPGCSSGAAVRRAEHLVAAVREHVFRDSEGERIAVTLSAGVAHAPTEAQSLEALYAAADAGLYLAKRSGRDQVGHTPTVEHGAASQTISAARP